MASRKSGEVEAFIRRPEGRYVIMLVYGPDAGLVNERARSLAHGAVDDPRDGFSLIRLEGDELAQDSLKLADEANTMGLFGGKRAIWVRLGNRNLVPSLEPLIAAPPVDSRIVIEAGDLQARAPLRALVERAPCAMALPCYSEARDLPGIIDDMLGAQGLSVAPDARAALVDHLGSDQLLTRRELEKLALYVHGTGRVDLADVEAIVADAAALAFDQLVDAVFLGQAGIADHAMTRLTGEGENAGVLVGFVLRHALILHQARAMMDHGTGLDEATHSLRIFFRRKDIVRRQLVLWSLPGLESAIATLRDAVAMIRRQGQIAPVLASRALLTIALAARRR